MKSLLRFCTCILLMSGSTHASTHAEPPPEVRGTWLTTTANAALEDPENIGATMKRLRRLGLNTVYVETWKNGYTQFPSPALEEVIGRDRTPALQDRDLVAETLIEAHRHGLLYIAWFEYGFMAAHQGTENHLRRMKPEWLSRDAAGNTVAPNGFVWMNPLHPEVQSFLIGLILDAVRAYDLDGVQLDDRLAWPHYTMGYDDYTLQAYAREHDGRAPPADPRDPDWLRWRADQVTAFARRLHRELRRERPDLILSISPGPYPWSYDNYACDWPAWAAEGLFDEFVPQVYRTSFDAFEPEWLRQVEAIGARTADLLAGIRIVGSGPETPWPDLEAKLNLSRTTRTGGHVLWFSRGVMEVYPGQLERFYEDRSPAPHPRRPHHWRPPPVTATRSADSPETWTAVIATAGRYRTIVRRNGGWLELESKPRSPGTVTLRVEDADEVELLIDRRQ